MNEIDLVQTIAILANIGVLAGIMFLGFELRQNTAAARTQASQGIQDNFADILSWLSDERMAEIYLLGSADPDQLNATERVMFNSFVSSALSAYENLFALRKAGTFPESRARGNWLLLRTMFEYPGIRQVWNDTNYRFSDEFRTYVESKVMALEPSAGSSVLPAIE